MSIFLFLFGPTIVVIEAYTSGLARPAVRPIPAQAATPPARIQPAPHVAPHAPSPDTFHTNPRSIPLRHLPLAPTHPPAHHRARQWGAPEVLMLLHPPCSRTSRRSAVRWYMRSIAGAACTGRPLSPQQDHGYRQQPGTLLILLIGKRARVAA